MDAARPVQAPPAEAQRHGEEAEGKGLWNSRCPWFLVVIALFALITAGVIWLARPSLPTADPVRLGFLMGIWALASYRAGRILALDDIARPLRAPFVRIREEDGEEKERVPFSGLRGAIGCLIKCPDCCGFWAGAVLLYAYFLWPMPALVVATVIAISGLGLLIDAAVMALEKAAK